MSVPFLAPPFFPSAFLAANSTNASDPSAITNHPLALLVWIGVGVLGLAAGAIAVTSSERRLRTSGVTIVAEKRPLVAAPAEQMSAIPAHVSTAHETSLHETSLIDSESGLLSVG